MRQRNAAEATTERVIQFQVKPTAGSGLLTADKCEVRPDDCIHLIGKSKEGESYLINGVELSKEEQEYLLGHFFCIIVGKPGSGKTFLLQRMIIDDRFYAGKFDRVCVVSPSFEKMDLDLPRKAMTTTFSLGWIFRQILKCNLGQYRYLEEVLGEDQTRDLFYRGEGLDDQGTLKDSFMTHTRLHKTSHLEVFKRRLGKSFNPNSMFALSFGAKEQMRQIDDKEIKGKQRISRKNGKGGIAKEKGKKKRSKGGKNILQGGLSGIQSGNINFDPSLLTEEAMDTIEGRTNLLEFIAALHQRFKTKLNEEQTRKGHVNMLLVLDDVVGAIKAHETDPHLSQLFLNRRHLIANGTISIIVVSQKYTLIPSRIRSNASWLILFRLNPIDFENVFRDAIILSTKSWRNLLYTVFGAEGNENDDQNKYAHLGVWVERNKFFKNFDLVVPSTYPDMDE